MKAIEFKSVKGGAGVTVLLLLVAIILAVLVFVEVTSLYVNPAAAQSIVEKAARGGVCDSNDLGKYMEPSKGLAEQLKKNNLFVKQPPKQHPVREVIGILGGEVLIGDKWYAVGATIGDAKIVAVEPTQVKIEWNGQVKTFAPIAAAAPAEGPESKRAAKRPEAVKTEAKVVKAQPATDASAEVVEAPQDDPLAFMGVQLSPKVRAKLLEKWNELSDEEKAEAKESWSKMPDEQKERALEQMERNIDEL